MLQSSGDILEGDHPLKAIDIDSDIHDFGIGGSLGVEAFGIISNMSSDSHNTIVNPVSSSTQELENTILLKGLTVIGKEVCEDCSLVEEIEKTPLTIYDNRPSKSSYRMPISSIGCQNVTIRKKNTKKDSR